MISKKLFSIPFQNSLCSHIFKNYGIKQEIAKKQSWILSQSHECRSSSSSTDTLNKPSIKTGPGLGHFIANITNGDVKPSKRLLEKISHPYVSDADISGHGRKVYFDIHGCQMNFNDVEVAWAILKSVGYEKTDVVGQADVILIMTCAIREGAEQKIWRKLRNYKFLKRSKHKANILKVGVLGCMAERLKKQMLEKEKLIDLVMGPDSYRDLPRLLAITQSGEKTVNVLLSQEETYADIQPVSLSENRLSAFVSITRGCDNMCSYCIVPFTRGIERSRPVSSILDEIRVLSDQGVKEVTLLGQNVNSYCDTSSSSVSCHTSLTNDEATHLSDGFKTIYKPKVGGVRFADLLEEVSNIDHEMRIRFTSPHPKDFPNEVISLIKERHNICNQIHLPAQCGSTRVLDVMRRGYTRESYMNLVYTMRSIIPDIALSSDFIAGFCSETDQEFQETLTLMEEVKYNFCYVFPYSMREKTPAHRDLKDDVPEEVKARRHLLLLNTFRKHALEINTREIGKKHIVLVEGKSKRSDADLAGRSDSNTKVIFPDVSLKTSSGDAMKHVEPGDYVEVMITEASSQVMKGMALRRTSLKEGISNLNSITAAK